MSHDVEICMAHDAYVGAMNLMMSHTSALAGYYAGRGATDKTNDHDEFMVFYNAYFKVFPDIQELDEKGKMRSLIYTHFRCGLIHEHLMKKGTALDTGLSKPPFSVYKGDGSIVLNIDSFFADYLRVLSEYSNDVRFDRRPPTKQNFINRARALGANDPII